MLVVFPGVEPLLPYQDVTVAPTPRRQLASGPARSWPRRVAANSVLLIERRCRAQHHRQPSPFPRLVAKKAAAAAKRPVKTGDPYSSRPWTASYPDGVPADYDFPTLRADAAARRLGRHVPRPRRAGVPRREDDLPRAEGPGRPVRRRAGLARGARRATGSRWSCRTARRTSSPSTPRSGSGRSSSSTTRSTPRPSCGTSSPTAVRPSSSASTGCTGRSRRSARTPPVKHVITTSIVDYLPTARPAQAAAAAGQGAQAARRAVRAGSRRGSQGLPRRC